MGKVDEFAKADETGVFVGKVEARCGFVIFFDSSFTSGLPLPPRTPISGPGETAWLLRFVEMEREVVRPRFKRSGSLSKRF